MIQPGNKLDSVNYAKLLKVQSQKRQMKAHISPVLFMHASISVLNMGK